MFSKGRAAAEDAENARLREIEANRQGLAGFAMQSSAKFVREIAKVRMSGLKVVEGNGGFKFLERGLSIDGLLATPICVFLRENKFSKIGFFGGHKSVSHIVPIAGIAAICSHDYRLSGPGAEIFLDVFRLEYSSSLDLRENPEIQRTSPGLCGERGERDCRTVDEALFRLGRRQILEYYGAVFS